MHINDGKEPLWFIFLFIIFFSVFFFFLLELLFSFFGGVGGNLLCYLFSFLKTRSIYVGFWGAESVYTKF